MTPRLRETCWLALVALLLVSAEEWRAGELAVAGSALVLLATRNPDPTAAAGEDAP